MSSGEMRVFDPIMMSGWRVRDGGRVDGVQKEGEESVWGRGAAIDEQSAGLLSIGNEAGCLAAVGAVGVIGTDVVAI